MRGAQREATTRKPGHVSGVLATYGIHQRLHGIGNGQRSGHPAIRVVQPTQDGNPSRFATGLIGCWRTLGNALLDSSMGPGPVNVPHVLREHAPRVPLDQDPHAI
jgi:hypothetical protein